MFTYVKAKNFKSLKNISFNLNKTKNETNKFIAIYGENGSGKTNLVELFKFLQQLTISRIIDVKLNMLPKEFFELKEKMIDTTPMDMKPIWQLSLNLDEYRMINEEEDTEIEYGFKINNKEGFYSVKFNKEIVEEKLYFFVNKQKGYYFKLSKNEKELNKNIFINEKYNEELKENIEDGIDFNIDEHRSDGVVDESELDGYTEDDAVMPDEDDSDALFEDLDEDADDLLMEDDSDLAEDNLLDEQDLYDDIDE